MKAMCSSPMDLRMAFATLVLPEPVPPAMATTRTGLSNRPLVGEQGLALPEGNVAGGSVVRELIRTGWGVEDGEGEWDESEA